MKISVKTLKGEIFQVTAESTDLVSTLKQKIQATRDDLGADRQKLIHAGKVLKDEQSLADLGLSESDFIVCMVTKELKKPAPAAAAPAPTPAAAPAPASSTPAPAAPAPAPVAPVAATPVAPPAAAAARAPARPTVQISPEATQALVGMGFPETEVRAALTAAMGNPDLAYEFLLTGIPDGLSTMMGAAGGPATPAAPAAAASAPAAAAASPASGGAVGIEALRQHPQFNMLKQAVQQNPAMLPQVLELIGAQSPALLQAIHANNEAFIEMMNEPITDTPAPAAPAAAGYSPPAQMGGGMDPTGGMGMDPMQILQVLAGMTPAERAQLAPTMGMAPEQLEAYIQMIASLPPEQMRNIAARAGEMGGMRDPPNVIRLTEEEMAAVNRLVALGFSQQQAAQAYLSCDKNEELAANLLFEGGWMDDEGDMGDFGGDDAYN